MREIQMLSDDPKAVFTNLVRRILCVFRDLMVGDRTGAVVLLVALLFIGTTWRINPYINDNYTIANTLVAITRSQLYIDEIVLIDGQPHLEEVVYGPTDVITPGMHVVDGRLYGRNYGQIFLTLPFLGVVSASAMIVNPALMFPAVWSVLLFMLVVTVGTQLDRRGDALLVGGVLAVLSFGLNLFYTEPIDPKWHAWIALQLSTLVAAALVAVFVYRIVARMYDRRVGVVAGIGVALATPVGFWGTIPKRHTLTALFAVLTLYCFYRSREADSVELATRFRALAYVPVGLATWVHAPEGLVLFVALGTIDIATARSNAPRHLAIVAVVFGISLLPFLVTNTMITGNPFQPPRALSTLEGGSLTSTGSSTGGGAAAGNSTVATSSERTALSTISAIFSTVIQQFGLFFGYMLQSAGAVLNLERLFGVVVRSNHGLGTSLLPDIVGLQSVNLSVLESMPLVGALFAAPAILYRGVRRIDLPRSIGIISERTFRVDPKQATDLMAVTYLLLLVVMYLPRLPIHASFTVRYLHPLYPICVYFLARLEIFRRTVHEEYRLLVGSYAAFVLFGGPLFAFILSVLAGDISQAVQYHARLSLTTAAILLYWAVIETVYGGYERFGAVTLAAAGALTTAYLLLSAFEYFTYTDRFALPISRLIAEIPII